MCPASAVEPAVEAFCDPLPGAAYCQLSLLSIIPLSTRISLYSGGQSVSLRTTPAGTSCESKPTTNRKKLGTSSQDPISSLRWAFVIYPIKTQCWKVERSLSLSYLSAGINHSCT